MERHINKTSLKISILFECCLSAVFLSAQSYSALPRTKTTPTHSWSYYKPSHLLSDTNTFIINYDSADSKIWGNAYLAKQAHLINMHYTANSDSSAGNDNVTNYFSVAFDSLIDPYNNTAYSPGSISSIGIDTIIIPLIQVNHSGKNDTLDVQLNSVDANGYPTTTILQDAMIISNVIGDTNSSSYASLIKVPENYSLLSGSRFAVTVKYYGAKADSCWFIFGCGSFVGTCDSTGPYTLAEPSNFSKVETTKGSFIANSFVLYNRYQVNGLYPTAKGTQFYYDCNNDTVFTPGIDGLSYLQNINVYVMVTTLPLGIDQLNANGLLVSQNYPNPFNEATQINYSIIKYSDVEFTVYDIAGRKLIDNTYTGVVPGQHIASLNADEFAQGVYFFTFHVNGAFVTRKMVVVR